MIFWTVAVSMVCDLVYDGYLIIFYTESEGGKAKGDESHCPQKWGSRCDATTRRKATYL